jgi:hypothetical protein
MKFRLAFVTGRCCPLQISPLPSLCCGSSVIATAGSIAGTGFLESCIPWSVIVPEFQGYLGNSALIPSVLFSETVRNSIGINWLIKEVGRPQPFLVVETCCTDKAV